MTSDRKVMPLNLFQRAMNAWDESIPYNATHSVKILGRLDPERIRDAIFYSLKKCGFTCTGNEPELEVISGILNPTETLRATFEEQLNTRFSRIEGELPFRFFVIDNGEQHFVLGVCYYHSVASADCICWLLEDIVATFADSNSGSITPWATVRTHQYRRAFYSLRKFFPRWLAHVPDFSRDIRKYTRIIGRYPVTPRNRVVAIALNAEQQAWIHEQMKITGAKFNDILMGLALFGIGRKFPKRLAHHRRDRVAVGSIINIRRIFAENDQRSFGLFLAFFSVSYPLNKLSSIQNLFGEIRKQTQRIKRERLFMLNLLVLGFGNWWRRFLSASQRDHVSLKGFPLVASITNFFVDQFQRRMDRLPVSDYWRGVSSGPATPLVVSATTFGDKMNLMLIFNDSIYSHDEIKSLAKYLTTLMHSHQSSHSELETAS